MSRTGSIASNGSGDIFISFSTANAVANQSNSDANIQAISNEDIVPLFAATVQATEEAIINALVSGRTMTGNRGNTVNSIDHSALREVLRRHNRLIED